MRKEKFEKKEEPITFLTKFSQVEDYADGATLSACKTLYEKGICSFCSNFKEDNYYTDICCYFNSLSDENKEILYRLLKEKPENYCIQKDSGFYGSLGESQEISVNRPMQFVFGFSSFSKETPREEIDEKMNELANVFKKQTFRQGVYTREEVLNNKHHQNNPMLWLNGYTEESNHSTNSDSNEQIAQNENLLYSKKYDMFFENLAVKSRYIESLYRQENETRTEEEIAKENGVFYFSDKEMFFEHQHEYEYNVTPKDLAKVSEKEKIGSSIIRKFKNLIERIGEILR